MLMTPGFLTEDGVIVVDEIICFLYDKVGPYDMTCVTAIDEYFGVNSVDVIRQHEELMYLSGGVGLDNLVMLTNKGREAYKHANKRLRPHRLDRVRSGVVQQSTQFAGDATSKYMKMGKVTRRCTETIAIIAALVAILNFLGVTWIEVLNYVPGYDPDEVNIDG